MTTSKQIDFANKKLEQLIEDLKDVTYSNFALRLQTLEALPDSEHGLYWDVDFDGKSLKEKDVLELMISEGNAAIEKLERFQQLMKIHTSTY